MEIIIAEDDAVTRERLILILRDLGHQARAYPDGRTAWEAFQKKPARVIISDWMMPEMDGLEFCRQIRRASGHDYVYFVLVTALRTEEIDYDQATEAGVDDFLMKPIDRSSIGRRLYVAARILQYTVQIRQLKDLLPICMYCKKIRNDRDYWQSIENYIHEETGVDFSHGICPQCYDRYITESAAED